MAAGRGQYIVLMNSDLLATPGCKPAAPENLRAPEVAVVGPRLVGPRWFPGRCRGGRYQTNGRSSAAGVSRTGQTFFITKPIECLSVCGACLGLKTGAPPGVGVFWMNIASITSKRPITVTMLAPRYKVVYPGRVSCHPFVNGSCRNFVV